MSESHHKRPTPLPKGTDVLIFRTVHNLSAPGTCKPLPFGAMMGAGGHCRLPGTGMSNIFYTNGQLLIPRNQQVTAATTRAWDIYPHCIGFHDASRRPTFYHLIRALAEGTSSWNWCMLLQHREETSFNEHSQVLVSVGMEGATTFTVPGRHDHSRPREDVVIYIRLRDVYMCL